MVRREADKTGNEQELREFEMRIAVLDRELKDKQNEIRMVETEKR